MAENSASRFKGFANANAIDMARFEASEVRAVLKTLEELEVDIVGILTKENPSIRKQRRLGEVRRAVEEAINDTYSIIKVANKKTLGDLAKVSHESTVAALNKSIGADVFNPVLTERQLAKLTNANVIFGQGGAATISQWWDGQRNDFRQKFARLLRLGYAAGEGAEDIAKRIIGTEGANFKDGATAVSKRNAEVLTRTAVQNVSNEARLATFAANADVIKGVEWLATLDDRTCPICRALDGLQWELNADGSVGDPIGHSKAYPGGVAHFQCRCTTISVTRSWDELNGSATTEPDGKGGAKPREVPPPAPPDKPASDIPTMPTPPATPKPRPDEPLPTLSGSEPLPVPVPNKIPRRVKEGEVPDQPVPIPSRPKPTPIPKGHGDNPGQMTDGEFERRVRAQMAKNGVEPEKIDKAVIRARASMDGQVSDSLDFDEWLRRQSDARRRKILGPSRKELFDRGVITTRDMTDQSNRPITIPELRQKVNLNAGTLALAAVETEGVRQAFRALDPGEIAPFVKPDRAAEIERAAAARIEDTLTDPAGREILAAELQVELNSPGAERRSPAEIFAAANARAEIREAAARRANVLRNARARLIRGDKPTPSQSRLIDSLTPEERRNFDQWVEDSKKDS